MLLFNIIFTILLAFLVGGLFYYIFKYTGPWGSFWTFVTILVLAGIAASTWIQPAGPAMFNLPWLPVLFIILMFALLLAAAGPARKKSLDTNPTPEHTGKIENKPSVVAISTLFWIFLILLIIAAITGILR
jgi:peptidoglycan/LPS O-acetylase OafA/YrhL